MTPAPRKGIVLESLTWPEPEALFRRMPTPVIVLPVGARTKEHGLHLPLNLRDALPVVALPGIPYGYYPAFLELGRHSMTLSTLGCASRKLVTLGLCRRARLIVGRTRSRALAPPRLAYHDCMTHGDEAPIQAVDPAVARALRSMSGMERLRLGHESWELARDRLTAYFAYQHPDWSPEEIRSRVARRLLGMG